MNSQGVTDGHKAGISHHCQDKDVQPCKEHEKINLDEAAFIGYNLALVLDVLQHLWDGGGSDTDVYKGQVGEKEVNGGVEVGIWADMERKCPK